LVLACIRCNKDKAGMTPKQAGMSLLRQPVEPKANDPKYNFKLHIKTIRPEWQPWESWLYWNIELDK
jgi:5-methylcytosine-specific restriction endonuclease McrA